MITKFLYQMNVKNKRILTGLVENDLDEEFREDRQIPMVLESSLKLEEGERKISNFGKLYYGVFNEGMEYRYLNINDYMLKVKLNASDKVAFATPLSKEMIESILNNTNYLNCDLNVYYVESGYKLRDNLEMDDSYIVFFKKVEDDVYVQFTNGKEPQYVSVVDGNYDLVDDFKDAMRVYQKEVRNLLVTHGWVDKNVKKSEVALSHFNVFTNGPQSYLFGGENSFKVTFKDNNLVIENEPKITNEYRLAQDETRSQLLRNMLYGFRKPKSHVNKLLKVNDLYVSKNDKFNYTLVDIANKASLLPETEIEILKNAISLFIKEAKFKEIENDNMVNYYLYNEDNKYEVSTELKDVKSRLLNQDKAVKFLNEFENYDSTKGQYIIKSNSSYINIKVINNSFELAYLKSGYEASKFSLSQVNALEGLLSTKFEKRELEPIFGASDYLRINNEDCKSVTELYKDFLEEKNNTNIRFSTSIELTNIKYGSDKGSLEYLEYLFVKSFLDSKKLFDKVIKNESNILIAGSTSNLELSALSQSAKDKNVKVNATLLDTTKWGYYPKSYVSSNVKFDGAYRLELESLPKDFISKFDVIYVGKTWKGNEESTVSFINSLVKNDYKGLIVTTALTKEYGFSQDFLNVLDKVVDYNKYLFNLEVEGNVYNSLLDKKLSCFAIAKIANKTIKDAIKRK